MADIGRKLYDLTLSILQAMGEVWDWLNTRHVIGKIEIFGTTLSDGISITPLAFGGAVIIIILGIGLISLVNPFN
jgi:hypothetical protein